MKSVVEIHVYILYWIISLQQDRCIQGLHTDRCCKSTIDQYWTIHAKHHFSGSYFPSIIKVSQKYHRGCGKPTSEKIVLRVYIIEHPLSVNFLGMMRRFRFDVLYSGFCSWRFTSEWPVLLWDAAINISCSVRTPSAFLISSAKAGMKWFLYATCQWRVDIRSVVLGIFTSTCMLSVSSLPDSACLASKPAAPVDSNLNESVSGASLTCWVYHD